MFLTMNDELNVGKLGDRHAWDDWIGGDRFVTEIEAEPAGSGAADHASQQRGGDAKW